MIAISLALAYVASLAFAGHVLSLHKQDKDVVRVLELEAEVESLREAFAETKDEERIKRLESTVSTLSVQAGLRPTPMNGTPQA
jgi:hypothetical protein